MSGRLAGRVCIVTGASRGIGLACAEALAAEGASLALCAARSPCPVPAAAAAAPHVSARCDVSRAADVDRFFADVAARLGAPDVVVLNAGVLDRAPIDEMTEARWDAVLDVNLKGAFLCTRAVWPAMKARGGGRLIAIGSISGTLGTPRAAAYNASKWGLTGLMKSLAEEGRGHGIFCATVLPGAVDTEMLKRTPFAPRMAPADVARVVAFLSTEAPPAMTGAAVEVFG